MGFMEEIKKNFNPELLSVASFRALLIGDNACYLENVLSIKVFSPEEIVLSVKKGEIKIKGENLSVSKFCMGDVAVCGKIKSIERT